MAKDTKHFSTVDDTTSVPEEDDEDDEEKEELEALKKRSREMYELLGKAVGKKEKNREEEEKRRKFAKSLVEGVLLVEWEEKGEAFEVLEVCSLFLFPSLSLSLLLER